METTHNENPDKISASRRTWGENTVNKYTILGAALFCVVPPSVMAEGENLEEQIAAVKAEIAAAQQLNIELKTHLAARETEAAELRVTLKQIEDQIDALYIEQHLEAK